MGVSHTLWPPSITRAILARLWFAQGFTRRQKSKQQSHTCAPVVCTGFAQGLYKAPKNQNSRSIHTAASFICKAYMYMALKKCHLPVSPLAEVSAWHMFFSKTTFSSGLMITELKSNTKTTGWNKRPGASPTLTTRRNSPGTSRESIANQKDF